MYLFFCFSMLFSLLKHLFLKNDYIVFAKIISTLYKNINQNYKNKEETLKISHPKITVINIYCM